MKWMGIYFLGYFIFMIGVFAALWRLDVLDQIGGTWTTIFIVLAIGIGIMFAVPGSGEKKTVEIDQS